jgi:hypothetical protein
MLANLHHLSSALTPWQASFVSMIFYQATCQPRSPSALLASNDRSAFPPRYKCQGRCCRPCTGQIRMSRHGSPAVRPSPALPNATFAGIGKKYQEMVLSRWPYILAGCAVLVVLLLGLIVWRCCCRSRRAKKSRATAGPSIHVSLEEQGRKGIGQGTWSMGIPVEPVGDVFTH